MALRLGFRLSVLETLAAACNSQPRNLHALRPLHGTVGERE
jgi:hypothetical protein